MITRTYGVDLTGSETNLIGVQCQLTRGSTAFTVYGLPVKTAMAAAGRIRSAFNSMGLSLPVRTITVKILPISLSTEVAHFDLPIATSILAAMNIIPKNEAERHVCLGSLSKSGELIPVDGILSATIAAAKESLGLICPSECEIEAAWVGSVQVIAPKSLLELVNHFNGHRVLPTAEIDKSMYKNRRSQETVTEGGRSFLNVCNTKCLIMDGLLYPIFTRDHEYF